LLLRCRSFSPRHCRSHASASASAHISSRQYAAARLDLKVARVSALAPYSRPRVYRATTSSIPSFCMSALSLSKSRRAIASSLSSPEFVAEKERIEEPGCPTSFSHRHNASLLKMLRSSVPFSLRNISTFGWDTSAVQVGCSKYEGQLALRFDGVVCSVLSVNARFAAGAESGATFSGAKVPLRSPMSRTVSSFGLFPSLLKPMTENFAHFWSGSAHSHDNSVINTKQVGHTHKHTFGMDHLVLGVVDVVIALNMFLSVCRT